MPDLPLYGGIPCMLCGEVLTIPFQLEGGEDYDR